MCKRDEEVRKAREREIKHLEGVALDPVVDVRQSATEMGDKNGKERMELLLGDRPENKPQEEEKGMADAGFRVDDGGEVANDRAEVGREKGGVGLEEVSQPGQRVASHGGFEVSQLL